MESGVWNLGNASTIVYRHTHTYRKDRTCLRGGCDTIFVKIPDTGTTSMLTGKSKSHTFTVAVTVSHHCSHSPHPTQPHPAPGRRYPISYSSNTKKDRSDVRGLANAHVAIQRFRRTVSSIVIPSHLSNTYSHTNKNWLPLTVSNDPVALRVRGLDRLATTL
jgi:hypothetical protein